MNRLLELSVLCLMVTLTACNSQKNLFVENPQINGNENPYNYDNKIFIPQKEYIFDYIIIKNSDSLKYKIINDSFF